MEIAKSYDSMPYPSKFFRQNHPDHLATLAKIFGVVAKMPDECRVLELGCGNGSNLISHAYTLQDTNFIGVDISGKHIEDAKEAASNLNLSNIDFHKIDVLDMTLADFGKFDYITAHGLISWIPDFVREKVFSIFSEMLEENGVGYISYNAYPGAHYREITRDAMRFHTRDTSKPLEKVQKSMEFLSMLAKNSSETEIYQPILDFELKRHFSQDASDIYHDDLGEIYRPFYFEEFAKILSENKLQFLCEAELHAMSTRNFPVEVQELLNNVDDLIEREQYIDFFLGRIFRQTLFCRSDVNIDRKHDPSIIDNFYISSSLKPASQNADLQGPAREKFIGTQGISVEIDHSPTKTALKMLQANWAEPISTPKLLQIVRKDLEESTYKTEDWTKEFEITRAILFQIYSDTGFLKMQLSPFPADRSLSKTPKLNNLSAWQLDCGNTLTSLLSVTLDIDDIVSRHLLELLDGTRDKAALLHEIKGFVESNDEISDKKEILENMETWLNASLKELCNLGFFDS